MPHGSGHAGGGGFHGGGGYHGGGFHHHHHHHHRHNAYVYTGGPYYRYGYQRRSLGWGFGLFTFFVIVITLAIVFSVRYGVPDSNSSADQYAPIETRLVTYSSVFCESLWIRFDSYPSSNTDGTFQLLSQFPSLTGQDSFQFHKVPSFDSYENYHHWSYNLYKGSKLSFSVCKQGQNSPSSFNYYIIKGDGRFNDWVDHPSSRKAVKSGIIYNLCSSGDNLTVSYDVTNDDEYYMVFYLTSGTFDSLKIDFDIHRTYYVAQPDQIIANCSVPFSCEVGLPMYYTVGLFSVYTSDSVTWDDSYGVEIYCSARIWVYAVISVSCVLFFVAVLVGIVLCCCYKIKRSQKKYQPLRGETQPAAAAPVGSESPAPATAAYVSTGDAPPPYYGSTAPPKY